jgi:hypothetical protein
MQISDVTHETAQTQFVKVGDVQFSPASEDFLDHTTTEPRPLDDPQTRKDT